MKKGCFGRLALFLIGAVVFLCLIGFISSRLLPLPAPASSLPQTTQAKYLEPTQLTRQAPLPAIGVLTTTPESARMAVTIMAESRAITAQPATPEAATLVAPAAHVVPDGAAINVRSGPGTEFAVLGSLTPGQSAPITGKKADGTWWRIDFSGQPGWVSASVAPVSGDTTDVSVVE